MMTPIPYFLKKKTEGRVTVALLTPLCPRRRAHTPRTMPPKGEIAKRNDERIREGRAAPRGDERDDVGDGILQERDSHQLQGKQTSKTPVFLFAAPPRVPPRVPSPRWSRAPPCVCPFLPPRPPRGCFVPPRLVRPRRVPPSYLLICSSSSSSPHPAIYTAVDDDGMDDDDEDDETLQDIANKLNVAKLSGRCRRTLVMAVIPPVRSVHCNRVEDICDRVFGVVEFAPIPASGTFRTDEAAAGFTRRYEEGVQAVQRRAIDMRVVANAVRGGPLRLHLYSGCYRCYTGVQELSLLAREMRARSVGVTGYRAHRRPASFPEPYFAIQYVANPVTKRATSYDYRAWRHF
jgi:hypothetical protein